MLKYPIVFFDLDGTLVDSGEGITRSVEYALTRLGLTVGDRSQLNCFIGPPLIDSFMSFCGFTQEQAGEAVDLYRDRYRRLGVYENKVYPGIFELLKELEALGAECCLATSKPEVFANIVIDDMGLRPYIGRVFGAELDDKEGRKRPLRSAKADVIAYALAGMGVTDKRGVLMVGDRRHDIEGAKANGIASAGVLFGFGSREELESAGAAYIAETPLDITNIVKG